MRIFMLVFEICLPSFYDPMVCLEAFTLGALCYSSSHHKIS